MNENKYTELQPGSLGGINQHNSPDFIGFIPPRAMTHVDFKMPEGKKKPHRFPSEVRIFSPLYCLEEMVLPGSQFAVIVTLSIVFAQ